MPVRVDRMLFEIGSFILLDSSLDADRAGSLSLLRVVSSSIKASFLICLFESESFELFRSHRLASWSDSCGLKSSAGSCSAKYVLIQQWFITWLAVNRFFGIGSSMRLIKSSASVLLKIKKEFKRRLANQVTKMPDCSKQVRRRIPKTCIDSFGQPRSSQLLSIEYLVVALGERISIADYCEHGHTE